MVSPTIAARSCDKCEKYMFEDQPGDMAEEPYKLADGKWMERPKGTPTPCWMCPKVPQELRNNSATRASAIEPSDKSWSAFWFHNKCKAIGRFPEDAIVENNAGIIDWVKSIVEDAKHEGALGLLSRLVKV